VNLLSVVQGVQQTRTLGCLRILAARAVAGGSATRPDVVAFRSADKAAKRYRAVHPDPSLKAFGGTKNRRPPDVVRLRKSSRDTGAPSIVNRSYSMRTATL
jgi:hypothetical protein